MSNDTYSSSHFSSTFPFSQLDESSFHLALYELSHGFLNCDCGRLETLLLNPIEQPEFCNPFSSYHDFDSNFITCLPTSKIVVEEELNDRLDYV